MTFILRNNDFALRRFHELKRRAEELGARRDPNIHSMLNTLARDPTRDGLARTLEIRLAEYATSQQLNPNFLPAPPTADTLYNPVHPPDFDVGVTTETGLLYGPSITQDCGSIAITGIPGGGKTTLVQNIVVRTQSAAPQAAILIFDVKGDYTCLASLPGQDIHVHNLREELRLGIIRPPEGMDLDAWLGILGTHFCEYRGLKKTRHVLVDIIKRLSRHFGVDVDPTRPWPSLVNLLAYLRQMPGGRFSKDGDYRASLINETSGTLDDTGTILDTCDGVDLETHLLTPGSVVVLRMETLPVPAQQLIISLCVERILHRRIAANVHNTELQVLIVLDEAQLVLGAKADRESSAGVAPMASQLLKGREMGVGFVIVAHLLSDISRTVLASAKTMCVVGGLSDAVNIDIASQMMNLEPRARTMLPRLGRGQALVREIGTGGAYTDPFLVDLDGPDLDKSAIDEPTRQAMMAPRRAHCPARPSRPLSDYPTIMAELFPTTKAARNAAKAAATPPAPAASSTTATPASAAAATSPLSKAEVDLLQDCARHPADWITERASRLNIKDYKQVERSASRLAGQHVVALHGVRLGKRTCQFIEVTDLGWQVLAIPKPADYLGHGGFLHTVLIARLDRALHTKFWTNLRPEFGVGPSGHAVDLFGISPAGIGTAFEVTLSFSNVVSNAHKSLQHPTPVQALVFLCLLNSDCRKVERPLAKDPALRPLMSRIQVRRMDEFLS